MLHVWIIYHPIRLRNGHINKAKWLGKYSHPMEHLGTYNTSEYPVIWSYFISWTITTLSSIIMELENGPIVKETIVLDGPILHFHDYGRKSTISFHYRACAKDWKARPFESALRTAPPKHKSFAAPEMKGMKRTVKLIGLVETWDLKNNKVGGVHMELMNFYISTYLYWIQFCGCSPIYYVVIPKILRVLLVYQAHRIGDFYQGILPKWANHPWIL